MTRDHPPPELLERLFAGELAGMAGKEAQWAMSHIVGNCRICLGYLRATRELAAVAARGPAGWRVAQRAAGAEVEEAERIDEPGAYDASFLTGLQRRVAPATATRAHQLEAAALWVMLEAAPAARRLKLVTSDPRFQTWPVAARLLEAASEFHWRDLGWEVEGCRLALLIAERLPPALYPATLASDLRARALGGLADALRQDGQLTDAEQMLDRAWEAQEEGSGENLERAALLRVAANLQLAVGETGVAARLLRSAASIYRLYGEDHEQGRTLQKLALAVGHENPAEGVKIAERALGLVTPGREPRVELAARHLLIWFLNDCGLSWEALDLLERSRTLYRQCGESEPLELMPWVEARICRRLGELAAAESGLREAWHRCWAEDWHQARTLVSLDLAETLLAQGKRQQALRLLGSCQASLQRWRMHAEGLAAWRIALAAARGEGWGEVKEREGAGVEGQGKEAERVGNGRAGAAAAVLAEVALYFRRVWRRAAPFRGRWSGRGSPAGPVRAE